METACLTIKDLTLKIANKTIINKVSLEVLNGKTLAIVGESGAGKSMITQAIIQCLPATATLNKQASIKLSGQELLGLSEQAMCNIRGKDVGLIFQDAMAALNPVQKIGSQLIEALLEHNNITPKSAKNQTIKLLQAVGIKDPETCFNSYPHQLSGGMLQRALIASVLAPKPKLLIADEPTTALDVTVQAKLLTLLQQVKQDYNCGLIFISHDLLLVKDIADYVLVLKSGNAIEYDTAENFFANPKSEYSQMLLAAAKPTSETQSSASKQDALKTDNLSVKFKMAKSHFWQKNSWFTAVDNANLTIKKGATLALVGESGSGKTSLAKALLGINPKSGSCQWAQDIIPEQDIAVVFQNPFSSMNPRMRVQAILSELWQANPSSRPKDWLQVLSKALVDVGLSADDLQKYPHQFSGGQRQRLCIARAIVGQPKIIVLDEPTSALDVSIQVAVSELLLELQAKYGYSYLLITHDFVVVKKMAHHVAVMQNGKIVEHGTIKQVFYKPKQAYTKQLLSAIPGADIIL